MPQLQGLGAGDTTCPTQQARCSTQSREQSSFLMWSRRPNHVFRLGRRVNSLPRRLRNATPASHAVHPSTEEVGEKNPTGARRFGAGL